MAISPPNSESSLNFLSDLPDATLHFKVCKKFRLNYSIDHILLSLRRVFLFANKIAQIQADTYICLDPKEIMSDTAAKPVLVAF